MREIFSRGKIREKKLPPAKSGGYILIDALVTLFIVSVSFSGLAAFEALSLRSAGEQRLGVVRLTEDRNELFAYRPVTAGD